ncbi:MAG: DUF1499 domain-containing protein [Desulfocapsaceae bacterium]|nr:DUF1499 domain-containing protein [Desulfocapsaceae bacterium]
MKTAFLVLTLLLVVFILLFFILGLISRSGKAPGLVAGMLVRCPATPNCVCSEQNEDALHFLEPILLSQDITFDPLPILKNVVREMGGIIRAESDGYLAATFSSAIFGFIDDLEVRIDLTQNMVHIRSASRVGYGDAGVNRKRSELLKKLYNQKVFEAKQLLMTTPKSGGHGF